MDERTTFRALKVTCGVATTGAESAVCDCLVTSVSFQGGVVSFLCDKVEA